MKMKAFISGTFGVIACMFIVGCGTTSPSPDINTGLMLKPGKKTVDVDINDAPVISCSQGEEKCFQLISPVKQDVRLNYSMEMIELVAKDKQIPHVVKNSSEVIFVIEGSGILKIADQFDYILKPGTTVYIPAELNRTIINNTDKRIRYLSIFYPPLQKDDDIYYIDGGKKVKDRRSLTSSNGIPVGGQDIFSNKPSGRPSESLKNIQVLTPQEEKVPINPQN